MGQRIQSYGRDKKQRSCSDRPQSQQNLFICGFRSFLVYKCSVCCCDPCERHAGPGWACSNLVFPSHFQVRRHCSFPYAGRFELFRQHCEPPDALPCVISDSSNRLRWWMFYLYFVIIFLWPKINSDVKPGNIYLQILLIFFDLFSGSRTTWDSQTGTIAISCILFFSQTFRDSPESTGSAHPSSDFVASYRACKGCIRFHFRSGILPQPCKRPFGLAIDVLTELTRFIQKVFQSALAYGIWVLRSRRSQCKFEQAPLRANTLVVFLYLATCILLLILPW